jgi:dolichol-phosphate mannosyltransferase
MTQKKAFVIIPTYNERDNIEKTLTHVFENLAIVKNWQTGVLVVDDTSPDKTYELVKSLQKKFKNLELLINGNKAGLGGAYLKGMDHAFNQLKADLVFEFDADLSHDPAKLPLFFNQIDAGKDMVLGSRYIPGGSIPADWGAHRKFLSVVGNIVIMTILTNFSIRDWTTGYRAITKKVWQAVHEELTSERFSGYTFQIGFLHKAVQKGFKIGEVPFHFKDRTIGKSKIGPEYIKNTLEYIMKVRIKDLLKNRIFKFAMVGGIGALTQLTTLQLWRSMFSYQLAFFLAIECAVLMNFTLSNLWTFADRKLKPTQYPAKFVQFNLASSGSIIIQQIVAFLGESFVGLFALFTLPIINLTIDTGMMYAVAGILIGMFWNFFAYNTFIWKKKK